MRLLDVRDISTMHKIGHHGKVKKELCPTVKDSFFVYDVCKDCVLGIKEGSFSWVPMGFLDPKYNCSSWSSPLIFAEITEDDVMRLLFDQYAKKVCRIDDMIQDKRIRIVRGKEFSKYPEFYIAKINQQRGMDYLTWIQETSTETYNLTNPENYKRLWLDLVFLGIDKADNPLCGDLVWIDLFDEDFQTTLYQLTTNEKEILSFKRYTSDYRIIKKAIYKRTHLVITSQRTLQPDSKIKLDVIPTLDDFRLGYTTFVSGYFYHLIKKEVCSIPNYKRIKTYRHKHRPTINPWSLKTTESVDDSTNKENTKSESNNEKNDEE